MDRQDPTGDKRLRQLTLLRANVQEDFSGGEQAKRVRT